MWYKYTIMVYKRECGTSLLIMVYNRECVTCLL